MKKYIFLFLILALSTLSAQEDRPTAAILYFTAEEVLIQQQTKSLANHFSTALDSTKKVSMIAQSKVIGVLEKEGLDVSDCTTDACAVTIGGALGVSYVITGDVKKEGNTYTITAKMLSVAANTEKIEKSITYSGMLSDLNVQTEILAWKLFDLEAPSAVLMKVKMDYSNVGGKGRGFKGIPYWMIWGSLGLLAAGGGVAIAMAADGGSNGSPIGEPPNFPSAP
jgi:TolB-like protein|tara:strand:+ start:119 stop:790 length:672 start_codon:yes stop_codon:yes gene_type:complete